MKNFKQYLLKVKKINRLDNNTLKFQINNKRRAFSPIYATYTPPKEKYMQHILLIKKTTCQTTTFVP